MTGMTALVLTALLFLEWVDVRSRWSFSTSTWCLLISLWACSLTEETTHNMSRCTQSIHNIHKQLQEHTLTLHASCSVFTSDLSFLSVASSCCCPPSSCCRVRLLSPVWVRMFSRVRLTPPAGPHTPSSSLIYSTTCTMLLLICLFVSASGCAEFKPKKKYRTASVVHGFLFIRRRTVIFVKMVIMKDNGLCFKNQINQHRVSK